MFICLIIWENDREKTIVQIASRQKRQYSNVSLSIKHFHWDKLATTCINNIFCRNKTILHTLISYNEMFSFRSIVVTNILIMWASLLMSTSCEQWFQLKKYLFQSTYFIPLPIFWMNEVIFILVIYAILFVNPYPTGTKSD